MRFTGLVSFAIMAFAANSASAADLAVPRLAAPAWVAPYSWTGFYLGGNVGYGVARDPSSFQFASPPFGIESFQMIPSGVIGGVQAGFNWQVSNWVLGLETDFQGTSQRDSACVNECFTNPPPLTLAANISESISWLGTARGRLGVVAGPTLFYATGGLAYGRINTAVSSTNTFLVGTGTTAVSTATTRTGWTAGGGIEAALIGNWTAKIEYLYVDLGSQTIAFADPIPINGNDVFTTKFRDNIIRGGVNYRFGDPAVAAASVIPLKAPPLPPPVHDWTGLYAGVNLGYSVGNNPQTYTVADPAPIGVFNNESYRMSPQGVVGGGQLGANWQFANWLTGIEADIQATSQSDSACVFECSANIALFGFSSTVQQKLPWFGTARGRFGATAGPALFYVTGGLAYGNVVTNVAQDIGTLQAVTANFNQIRAGWTVGGGIEAALIGNWSAKAEYLYVDLGSQNFTFRDNGPPRTTTLATNFRDNIYRAGVNYKLDWYGPLVAR